MNEYQATEQAFKNGYKKAAEEIFEEIGKILYKHTNIAIKEKSVTCELTIDYIGEDIAELKKKYTEGEVDKCCENCAFYNEYRKDQPCCSCFDYINWELQTDG